MIRVTVLYPNAADVRFDHAYYAGRHRTLVLERLASYGLRSFESERGIRDGEGGPAPFIALGHLTFNTLADFERGWSAAGEELAADVPNFTNAMPLLQISEVTMPALQPYMRPVHDQREREPLH